MSGGLGDDVLIGGIGNDNLQDGLGNDVLYGGDGNDSLSLTYSGAAGVSLTQLADAGAGNDSIIVNPNGALISYTIEGGDGDDTLHFNPGTFNSTITASLGAGNDTAIFPSNDWLRSATISLDMGEGTNRVSNPVLDASNIILMFGAGDDSIINMRLLNSTVEAHLGDGTNSVSINYLNNPGSSVNVVSGVGDDSIQVNVGTLSIVSGAGNDTVNASGAGSVSTEEGNDIVTISGSISGDLGSGDDILRLAINGSSSVVLGAGIDKITIDSWNAVNSTTIADFETGAGGDSLNYNALLSQLIGWDGSSNPFGAGFAQLVQSGINTLLQIDRNGGGDSYTTLVKFDNTSAASFTVDNFQPAYAPDGSGISGQNILGDAGGQSLLGTIGDDVISGLGSADTLYGGNGSDRLIGGDGADTLSGGFGADVFVFNFPNEVLDTISDFTAGSPFGDHLEISASGFGGGLTAGMDVLSVFGSSNDDLFASETERFHFDTATDTLYFDADGSGIGAGAVAVAQILNNVALQHSDLLIV